MLSEQKWGEKSEYLPTASLNPDKICRAGFISSWAPWQGAHTSRGMGSRLLSEYGKFRFSLSPYPWGKWLTTGERPHVAHIFFLSPWAGFLITTRIISGEYQPNTEHMPLVFFQRNIFLDLMGIRYPQQLWANRCLQNRPETLHWICT